MVNFHSPRSSYCIILYILYKEQASRQTHTQETTKLTKENSTEKHKWKCAVCDHMEKKRQKIRSKAKFFRHMKIKISYTLEDGHVGRNM
jgi:hypothetical protein